jgi:hypothetical protein
MSRVKPEPSGILICQGFGGEVGSAFWQTLQLLSSRSMNLDGFQYPLDEGVLLFDGYSDDGMVGSLC